MYLNKKKIDNRLFLWGLLFLQLFLIIIFMIFGTFYINQEETEQIPTVKFIDHNNNKIDYEKLRLKENEKIELKILPDNGNFSEKFLVIKRNNNKLDDIICYREGTDNSKINDTIKNNNECKCLPEWHGKDCGQPEVLWRAFMTSKVPIKLSPPRKIPHKLFYIIQTTGISIETLEIQIMEVIDIIDLYILCDLINIKNSNNNSNNNDDLMMIKKHMSTGFLKINHNKILLIDDKTCSSKNIYKKLKTLIDKKSLNYNNVIIYSKSDEILNRKAINYFKWYDNWPQPVRFRLKYTVYGFFWQHLETTYLGSTVSQLNVLEEIYKSDPERMYINTKKTGIIIGDLNHFGGWLCRYCYQPIDIVKKLVLDTKTNNIVFNFNQIIDSNYIQNLISNGLYIDGKMGLIKLHRFSDKYYSPEYVITNSWKFDNIVINLFASWDDDYP